MAECTPDAVEGFGGAGTLSSVVFIVAHPDDVAHSMGGTALLLRDQHKLHVLCATKGERGIHGKTLEEAAAIREEEEAAACRLLDADLTFLGRIDGELFADKDMCTKVAGILRPLQPVAVFTLWPVNDHPDHVSAYDIATKAMKLAGLYGKVELYMSENTIGHQTNQFHPDLYVDISDVIEQKTALVRCHRSQNRDEGSVDRVIMRNVVRGMFAHCEYAEGFKTVYPLVAASQTGRSGSVLLDLGLSAPETPGRAR